MRRRTPVSLAGTEGNAVAMIRACALAARRDGWSAEAFRLWLLEATSGGQTWGLLASIERYFDVRTEAM